MVDGIVWRVKAGEWKILMTVLGMSERVMTDNIPCRMAGAEESEVEGKQQREYCERITGETTGHWKVSNTGLFFMNIAPNSGQQRENGTNLKIPQT